MSEAFGVQMAMYQHSRTGVHFRCPKSDIRIPKKLSSIIVGVFGLNDMPVVVRNSVRLATKTEKRRSEVAVPGFLLSKRRIEAL